MRPGCATCTSHASSSLSALTLSKPRWSDSLPRCGARVSKFRSSMKPSSVCGRRFFSTTASAQSGLHAGRPPADDENSGGHQGARRPLACAHARRSVAVLNEIVIVNSDGGGARLGRRALAQKIRLVGFGFYTVKRVFRTRTRRNNMAPGGGHLRPGMHASANRMAMTARQTRRAGRRARVLPGGQRGRTVLHSYATNGARGTSIPAFR